MFNAATDALISLAIALTAKALDRSRCQAERDELVAEAMALIDGIATA